VQRAMRHSSPETKRHYQLGMVEQVRQNLEKANEKVYGKGKVLRFHDGQPAAGNEQEILHVSNGWRRSKWRARGDSNSRPSA
jgi:hypothetical protein